MSSSKVMSLEEKVRIISKYKVLKHRREKRAFKILYSQILKDKCKILAQYEDMKAKLAAVRDLVITEYGKPNYIGEKHAFLEKVICEWYQRAEALPEIKKVPLALFCHKTDIALHILNISDLPLSETQVCYLKSKCHKASLERKSKFESTTLSIKKIAKELLKKIGLSKATAISMYGRDIFEEPEDDEDDVEFLRRTHHVRHKFEKRKLEQPERPPCKTPNTSNAKVRWGLEQELTEVGPYQNETDSEEEQTEIDTDSAQLNDCHGPYEAEVERKDQSEEEEFELYDVISVEDSTEDCDAATSSKHVVPVSLIKRECETTIDCGKEMLVPCAMIKVEPDEGQCSTKVQTAMGEWLIKKECEATDDEDDDKQACSTSQPICSIKFESEGLTDHMVENEMPTTTYFRDCLKQGTKEAPSNRDEGGSVHLYTVIGDVSPNADSASWSLKNVKCVENDEEAMHSLELLKTYLKQQRNSRALEALNKVQAALAQSPKKTS